MTSSHTDPIGLTYSDSTPILIAATSDVSLARAVRAVDASGCRVGAAMQLERARERIERQGAASLVWLEIDRDCGEEMDDLLNCVARNASAGRYAAVVSTTGDLLDPVAASLDEAPV